MDSEIRLLVVDDDFAFRQAIVAALQDNGWQVRSAATGAEALGVLQVWRPDVIVLDLVLPLMDGWAFHAETQRRQAFAAIPIILTSGIVNARSEGQKLNVAAVLPKPFDTEELVRLVRKLGESDAHHDPSTTPD